MNTFAVYTRNAKRCNVITTEDKPNVGLFGNGSRFIELESAETVQPMNQIKPTTLKNNKISSRIQSRLDRRVWANFA